MAFHREEVTHLKVYMEKTSPMKAANLSWYRFRLRSLRWEVQISAPTNVSLEHCLFELPTDKKYQITYTTVSYGFVTSINLLAGPVGYCLACGNKYPRAQILIHQPLDISTGI
jgi:hypothetical protein